MTATEHRTARTAETFGPTIQGEGPNAGRLSYFIRLGGCNLDCSWCDTPYTWDWTGRNGTTYNPTDELTNQRIGHLINLARQTGAPNLVLTGGEPLIQRNACTALTEAWYEAGHLQVEIETNGTRPPLDLTGTHYNVSLKLQGSGITPARAIKPNIINQFNDQPSVAYKFVITDEHDLEQTDNITIAHHIPAWRVWLMPEGRTREAIIMRGAWLADQAIARGYNFTSRLHVLAWGDQRGR